MDGYTYGADVWCEDCGRAICEQIRAEGDAPDNLDEVYSYEEYPQRADVSCESDSPQHCAAGETCLNAHVLPSGWKIGVWLENNLTTDGVEYVREQERDGRSEVTDYWWEVYTAAGYDLGEGT